MSIDASEQRCTNTVTIMLRKRNMLSCSSICKLLCKPKVDNIDFIGRCGTGSGERVGTHEEVGRFNIPVDKVS